MKISLYPTEDGCLRPDEVLARAKTCLQAGQRVAISSGDPAFDVLDGAVLVRRVGKAFNAFHAIKPAVAIIDALDFTDPDGQELVSRQEMPMCPPVLVAGFQFGKMLELLRDRSGTEEVILVSTNDAISPAWVKRLEGWDVHIRMDLAASKPWRTWFLLADDYTISPACFPAMVPAGPLAGQPPDEAPTMSAEIRSPRTHLLLAMAMEFADVFCCDCDVPADRGFRLTDNPGRLLVRMLAGKPVADRIRHCRQLEEDFRSLAAMASEYLQAQKGAGTMDGTSHIGRQGEGDSVTAARSRRPALVHPVTAWKLH